MRPLYGSPDHRNQRRSIILFSVVNNERGFHRVRCFVRYFLFFIKPIIIKSRMGKIAILFPGQGAQTVGMGRVLEEKYPEVRRLYATAKRRRQRCGQNQTGGVRQGLSHRIIAI